MVSELEMIQIETVKTFYCGNQVVRLQRLNGDMLILVGGRRVMLPDVPQLIKAINAAMTEASSLTSEVQP